MTSATFRPATAGDLPAVAALRWTWIVEENGATGVPSLDAFVPAFAAWAAQHASTHHAVVAELDGAIVGTAWLALVDRVPSPRSLDRRSGDVQSVYVVPELRSRGLGAGLLEAVRRLGRDLGVERLTVHSSERAVSAYARAGYAADERLRHRRP